MTLSRRALLAATPGLVFLGSSLGAAQVSDATGRLYLSGGADASLGHHVAAINHEGGTVSAQRLPDRGHAVAVSPDRMSAVICARRAGRFASVIDLSTLTITHQIDAAQDRHFYGHAVYSRDGARLFATENAFDAGEGRIGHYDVAGGYRRIAEWPSFGVGPHELALSSDGRVLVVANGGILTHPDSGREPLNLDTMAPNLAFIDVLTGALIRRIDLPRSLRLLSSRHLAVGKDGTIAVVMQYQGDEGDAPPLVALVQGDRDMRMFSAPEPIQLAMANYCGSVAFDRSGAVFGVSSPRGNMFTFWTSAGDFLSNVSIADGCGIAPAAENATFVLSSGNGGFWRYDIASAQLSRLAGEAAPIAHWDNHLTAV
ncbi:MAG: DUF1513 domain-containing protein [Pseudomonadota bacterium]